MKILQVCAYTGPYPGNFIKALVAIENKAQRKGYETIYAFPEKMKDVEWCKELALGHKIYYLPVAKARILPQTYYRIYKIYKENPDIAIVHSHFELYDVPVAMTAPKSVKIFWHVHDTLDPVLKGIKKYAWIMQYSILSRRAILLPVSDILRNTAIKIGFKKENAYTEPNCIDTDRIQMIQKGRETKTDFLMFGKFHWIKGVDLAEEAIRGVGQGAKLCVVGGREEDNEESRNYKIFSIPQSSDINGLYSSTKCFLHISRTEGLSYALLESLYTGLPVIVSDIPENAVAKEFPTAIIVKNENIDDIKTAMKRLIDKNFCVSETDILKSRQLIEEKYSLDSWAERILNDYLTLELK